MDNSQMIFSVSQVNDYIRALIDGDCVLGEVIVRGEISNLTLHRTGHIYFTLKDSGGVLRSVMFRSNASRLRFELGEGMSIIAYGRVSVYAASGQYQLYVSEIQPDGVGSLYLAYEQIKTRLAAQGLFDAERKRKIPQIPRRVGIVTSPTGAAIHDMINVITRRFPACEIVLYPAQVQGDSAAQSIISGIRYFNAEKSVDTLIVGRGGGSMEDLWAFNDVALAYAIAESEIPVISAVGHESDFTICDFVADLRAPTPSAAAELAVPDSEALRGRMNNMLLSAENSLLTALRARRDRISALASSPVLLSRERLVGEYRTRIDQLSERLDRDAERAFEKRVGALKILAAKLDAISPLNTLMRGYAIVQNAEGSALCRVDDIGVNDDIDISLSNGSLKARVREIRKNKEN